MPPATPRRSHPAKTALRDQVLAARRARPVAEAGEDARRIAAHLLAWEAVRRSATVACYVSVGREPGTGLLLDALLERGTRVIVPVLLPDDDVDWAAYTGPGSLAPAGRGLLEPVGRRLGVDAVATADVVLVPGLAASTDGDRLGRGGGSYDRVLARLPLDTPVCVLLHDDELDREVPVEPHDRRVTAAATPSGLRLF